jgi:hypothetical protein
MANEREIDVYLLLWQMKERYIRVSLVMVNEGEIDVYLWSWPMKER